MDNRSVLLLSSALEGTNGILSVQRRKNGSKTKSLVPFAKGVWLFNKSMAVVDLMDQHTAVYCPDRKSSVRYSFNLMDIVCVSIVTSFITSILTNCFSLITRLLSQKT